MTTYIVDIDGTVADNAHRQFALTVNDGKPNWDLFFNLMGEDKPIPHMQQLLSDLHQYWTKFVYCTGRPERFRALTASWLDKHDFPNHGIYMRPDGDHRPDHIVKAEMLAEIRRDGWKPIMAFDDRDTVVKMWRENGVPCAQVAEGNF